MKINSNGININCVIEGDGPWVTMSHSLACNLSMWDEQARLLVANGYKVLRFDTRGHGASDAPEGSYTLEQMADDLHGLYVALGIRQSPRGESAPPEVTFGPLGTAERLNWLVWKKRRVKTSSQVTMTGRS